MLLNYSGLSIKHPMFYISLLKNKTCTCQRFIFVLLPQKSKKSDKSLPLMFDDKCINVFINIYMY